PLDEDLAVLPGESLAKYQSAAGETSQAAEGWDRSAMEKPSQSSGPDLPEEEMRQLEARAAAFLFEREAPPAEATDSGSAPVYGAEEQQTGSQEAEGAAASAVLEAPAPAPESEPSGEETARGFEALFHEPAAPAAMEEAAQQEPEETATAEAVSEAGESTDEPTATGEPLEEEVEPAAAADAGKEMPAAEEEEPVVSGTASAAVIEPTIRLPHRISRRLRRKLRTQLQGELRPDTQRPAMAAAAETETVTAPEPEKLGPSITDLLKEGQEILVQIAKEPLGQKGARITSHIALPGRYVVYMPTVDHPGVSRKIASEEERARLRRIIQAHRAGMPGGFIVRTAGEGKSEEEIAADMMYLYNLWLEIRQKAEKRPAPALIHHDLDIVQRTLRDQLTENYKAIWVDSEEVYESVVRFVERMHPSMVNRVKLYARSTPIFDAFNITAELEKALRPKVWLKSGGYIVVNQTEALVAIDVNTGKFVGSSNRLEDTIVKTNLEAIREIVRQIRLRDLGGIIVVDFIDMEERKNRQKVMQALEEEMRRDRAPYKILQFNDFGLVAITRKRVKQSLERTLCSPCPYCEGAGYVKSVQTVVSEILQEARRIASAVEGPNVVLRVNPEVAKVLKATGNDYLEELEEILRRPVLVTGDPLLHQEKWDMA
ncbi:MAG: Rne/Rng family ribonuclease, partial [Bryobacteraceae bacterium]